MIKLSNENRIFTCIINGLIGTIRVHGPIHNNNKAIRSAAKRILGEIKSELYNTEVKNIKRVRDENGKYVEIDNSGSARR